MDQTDRFTRHPLSGYLLVMLAMLGFSSKAILVKLAYGDDGQQIDAITLMALRMLFSLPFFLTVALWRRKHATGARNGKDWGMLVGLGLLGYYLSSLLDFKGLAYLPAGLERLILFLYPTFVLLLNAHLEGRAVGRNQRVALSLSYFGLVLVYGEHPMAAGGDTLLGATLVLGSAISYAIYLVASSRIIPRFGSRRFTAWSMSVACLATLVHFLLSHPLADLCVSVDVLLLALAVALFATVLPAFLMNAGIQRIGADQTALLSALGPVFTLWLAWLVLDETMTPIQLGGVILMISGVAFMTRKTGAGRS